jgi:putative oxidoreductase
MEIVNEYNHIAVALIARVFLGVLFFFQGYDAVFKIKIKIVIETYQSTFYNHGIPKWLTVFAAWFTSLSALIGGAFLIIGFGEHIALYVLGFNLIITAIGFGINTPLWDTRFVLPRLMLILLLLVIPVQWNTISIDYIISKNIFN